MFSDMATATKLDLDHAVRVILSRIDADAIVLFGSQARGDAGEHSDIDLLLVATKEAMGGLPRYEILGKIWRDLAEVPFGMDLLLYTPEEVEQRRHSLNHVVARALREGRVLHGHA